MLDEILLYIWIAAFAYDEFGEFRDAGTLFYATDFWSLWDIGIVGIGIAFLVASTSVEPTRKPGLKALSDCLRLSRRHSSGPSTDISHVKLGIGDDSQANTNFT